MAKYPEEIDRLRPRCHDPMSRATAEARCEVAEHDIACGGYQSGIDLLAPVLAAPSYVVGDRAQAIARSLTVTAREMLGEGVPLDEVEAVALACEAAGEPYEAARRWYHVGIGARDAHELDRAIRMLQRAFTRYTEAGSSAAVNTRVRIAQVLHQRGDDEGALVELGLAGAYIGGRLFAGWQLVYNDIIALRAEIHAAAAIRARCRAAAVAHWQHALELSGPIAERGPRRDQQRLIDQRDRAELEPGNTPLVVTLEEVSSLTIAFSTRAFEVLLLVADNLLGGPVELAHPRTWLVASLAREVARDALGRGVDLDVVADASWLVSRLFHVLADADLAALHEAGRAILARDRSGLP